MNAKKSGFPSDLPRIDQAVLFKYKKDNTIQGVVKARGWRGTKRMLFIAYRIYAVIDILCQSKWTVYNNGEKITESARLEILE